MTAELRDSLAQVQALPMETAPRDGTMLRLLVEFADHATEDTDGPAWTIGTNNDDNVGEDERVGWQFAGWCWTHDHFTEGRGTPIGWLPMISTAFIPAKKIADSLSQIVEHGNELGVARIPSSRVSAYIAEKQRWKDDCADFLRTHGPELMKMLEERDGR